MFQIISKRSLKAVKYLFSKIWILKNKTDKDRRISCKLLTIKKLSKLCQADHLRVHLGDKNINLEQSHLFTKEYVCSKLKKYYS